MKVAIITTRFWKKGNRTILALVRFKRVQSVQQYTLAIVHTINHPFIIIVGPASALSPGHVQFRLRLFIFFAVIPP